jgi:hypothetical protein
MVAAACGFTTFAREHILDTYLRLLSLASGGEVIPLDAQCAA